MLLFYLLVFFFGTFIGSFLNVLIDRPARGETVFWGSSHCEKCNHKLVWNDLIPLWSYIRLGGRCRYCRSPIPFWLPVVEVTTGLLFVLATYIFGLTSSNLSMINMAIWLYGYMAISLLIVIFFSDLKYHLIYDSIVYLAIGTALLCHLFCFFMPNVLPITHYALPITNYFFSAFLSAAFFYLLYALGPKIFHQDTMGFGDVKLAFLMGLLLGYPKIIIALYLAFLTGALVGVILILVKKAEMRSQIAFGPFLVGATFVVGFFGEGILEAAMTLFY